jgi:hypothetical protein
MDYAAFDMILNALSSKNGEQITNKLRTKADNSKSLLNKLCDISGFCFCSFLNASIYVANIRLRT